MTEGNNWISFSTMLPPEGEIVSTKIDDEKGIRNEQELKNKAVKRGNLELASEWRRVEKLAFPEKKK